jgi:flagellar biosynthetic protein FlhB
VEVVALAVLVTTAGGLALYWTSMVGQLREYVAASLRHATEAAALPGPMLAGGVRVLAQATLPLLALIMLAALVVNLVQVGGRFTLSPVVPRIHRLDPWRNAERLFSGRAMVELIKMVAKVVGIGWVTLAALKDWAPRFAATVHMSPEHGLALFGQCALSLTARIAVLVVAIAGLDFAYQRYRHRKRMRMTREEVRREQREGEGDPQRKAERQRLHREIVEHQMLEAVAQADCVIINPDHVAVALRYDAASMDAPRVVARGHRRIAAEIRKVARQHGVPIVRDVPLARALVDLELDEEVPQELYEAVAEVLRFVHGISREAP